MSARPLIVYGAGGHGKVVADILIARGEKVTGFLDDTKTADIEYSVYRCSARQSGST